MRIGMIVDVYKPHISGITNYISLNKKYLEYAGHEVFIFTFGDEHYQDDEENVIRSPGLPLLDTGYYISLQYSQQALKYLSTIQLAHVHHPFLSGSLALRYCRPRGIPIVFTNHTRYDLYAKAYIPMMPDIVSAAAMQAYLPTFCRACDLVIAPSKGLQEVLVNFGVDVPIEVVPNGVDLKPFSQPLQPIKRSELNIQEDDVVLMYIGRLGPEKNLPFLLRSFAGTSQAYNKVKLVLVGDGPERDNLEDRVQHMGLQSEVRFVGMVPYEEVPRYLQIADTFVTASVTEVHPLSVIEAMAAGLPVLGISSPGISDTIVDGETGFLSPEEDLTIFTAKMVRMVMDHQHRRVMGTNARQAAKNYAIERTTQMMIERYQRVIAQARRRKQSVPVLLRRWLDGFRK